MTSPLQDAAVLVTGATGFVGSYVCKALTGLGARVVRVSQRVQGPDTHALDIADRSAVTRLVATCHPQFVVHLAAWKSRTRELDALQPSYLVNTLGTLNLAEACCDAGMVARFVHVGTCEEYGLSPAPFDESAREQPVTAYGASKLAATQLLQLLAKNHGFPAVILRPTLVYGPGQPADMFLPALAAALLSGQEFPMTAGEQTRDYLYVEDLVTAIVKALLAEVPVGAVINVGSGVPRLLKDVAELVANQIGKSAVPLLRFGALEYRSGEMFDYRASLQRASQWLSWQAQMPLESGIAHTVAQVRRDLAAKA